jgi:membrane protein YqaA with SNARE-associated domain
MKTVLAWIQAFAVAIGGPGLFIIAFLDSSFLSFPQVIDLLVVTSVLQHPHWMPYYAVMSTLGSILGCLTIYSVARKGGEALLRRRFSGAAVDRAQAVSTRYGVFALLVPSLLPPPAPFKLFVLLAGVSGLRPVRFALTIALGRGLRYFGIGLLTLWYGQQTLAFLETNGRTVAYWLAGIVVVGALVALIWRQLRRRQDVLTSPTRADIIP